MVPFTDIPSPQKEGAGMSIIGIIVGIFVAIFILDALYNL